jgi:hypothetical protein
MTSTTNLNDNLIKIDNLITGLNFLVEELETRKQEYTNRENVETLVKDQVTRILNYDDEYLRKLSRRVANEKWYDLLSDLASRLQPTLETVIKEHVNVAVEKELHRLGVTANTTQN